VDTPWTIDAHGRSDVGRVRTNNEDSFVISPSLLLVSDGVGGRPAGEVASTLTAGICRVMAEAGVAVEVALQGANETVASVAALNPLFTGMCCTATAITVGSSGARLGHVGDSKAWLVRGGQAEAITEDQTITARLVRTGEMTAEDALTDRRRSTLYQAVGTAARLDVDVTDLDLKPGDRLILATDGIDYAPADALEELLSSTLDAESLVDAIVDAALIGGGNDNVTVIVADIVSPAG